VRVCKSEATHASVESLNILSKVICCQNMCFGLHTIFYRHKFVAGKYDISRLNQATAIKM